ncbi:MAG TPA: lysylphosphatidylglycerol synthase transmembrane domain-containing protein [Bacteroidales bacterium]|nr:lysylphosphatidylglycerol synthase transmembrane domain-containing protein [Bacteroidales bacterium]
MPDQNQQEVIKKIRLRNIILPIIIGLAIILWFSLKEFNRELLNNLIFSWRTIFFLALAFCCMICRDLGYMIRIRILSENDLTWRKAFRIIMLWEFTSAISPSTIGGTAVAVVFIHKEGINVGRSASIVLITSFFDELYFVLLFPVLIILIGGKNLFMQNTFMSERPWYINELFIVAVIGYSLKFVWVILVGYGIFFNPEGLRKLIVKVFSLPLLRRWKSAAINAGDDVVISSQEFRKKPLPFWLKAGLATFLSWTARYWVVNSILVAFFVINNHFLIFARQLVMWIMMLISPTPGGTGLAEIIFTRYLSDFIPVSPGHLAGTALAMALIWRVVSYYPYLFVGAIIGPHWVDKNFFSGRRGVRDRMKKKV